MNKIMIEIKLLASLKGLTLSYVAQELGKRLGKHYGLPNLSNKLKRGTISYEEVKIIFDILGYDIKLIDKITKKPVENLF